MKKIRALLFLLFLIYWGCNPSHISEIKKNEKPIEYKVPLRSRFNVPSLLTMDIENIEKILGKPINDWKPTKYQKAVGVNLSSNKLWKIKSTSIDVEYKNQILAYLIANGYLEIRFAVPNDFDLVKLEKQEPNDNLYHVKNLQFDDYLFYQMFQGSPGQVH